MLKPATAPPPQPPLLQRAQAEWQAWRESWDWLAENPLVFYLGRTQKRSAARVPMWQKLLLGLVLGALGIATVIMVYIDQSGSFGGWGSITLDIWVGMCTAAVYMLYVLWAFEGLHRLIGDCMRLLALPGKRSISLQLDDMLALTHLNDRDILLALLRVVMPRFMLRIAAGALLYWLTLILFQSNSFQNLSNPEVWQTFILGPVTMGSFFLSGSLAGLLIALISICLGRSLKPDTLVLSSTILIAMSQGTWLLISLGILSASGSSGGLNGVPPVLILLLGILAPLAAGFVLVANIGLATERRWWRSTMAAAWPMLIVATAMVYLLVIAALWLDGSPPEWYGLLGWMYLFSWSSVAPLNPLAIPSICCIGVAPQTTLDIGNSYSFISPGSWFFQLLLLQLALAVILLYMARQAVRLRRHETS